ncbi:hypothetical protein EYF80_040180 [Liparis tanakae]|uniref:Uncharacterized protein n=1 Tax=Liparis tanakae TaxID=230148 RepID=A0A4Z2GAM2_9TELE|nr:hypothetical protein EYF80_040180 [Liparis tanakae]
MRAGVSQMRMSLCSRAVIVPLLRNTEVYRRKRNTDAARVGKPSHPTTPEDLLWKLAAADRDDLGRPGRRARAAVGFGHAGFCGATFWTLSQKPCGRGGGGGGGGGGGQLDVPPPPIWHAQKKKEKKKMPSSSRPKSTPTKVSHQVQAESQGSSSRRYRSHTSR